MPVFANLTNRGAKGECTMYKFAKSPVTSLMLVCAVMMTSSAMWPQALEITQSAHHDVSPPMWSVSSQAPRQEDHHVRPVHPIPVGSTGPLQPDPVLQSVPSLAATPGTTLNFA